MFELCHCMSDSALVACQQLEQLVWGVVRCLSDQKGEDECVSFGVKFCTAST